MPTHVQLAPPSLGLVKDHQQCHVHGGSNYGSHAPATNEIHQVRRELHPMFSAMASYRGEPQQCCLLWH